MTIRPRNQWTNRDPRSVVRLEGAVDTAVLHWPANRSLRKPLEDQLKSFQDFHMDERGWSDIAYNHALFPDGRLFEGRGWGVQGAHTFGHNKTSYGLLLMVTMEGDEAEVTPAMADGAARWLREGEARGHFARDTVVKGHGELRDTECPGPEVRDLVRILNETGWREGPAVSDELAHAYHTLLDREPTEFAAVWQRKIDLGLVTLDYVKFELVGVRLNQLEDLIPQGGPLAVDILAERGEDLVTEEDLLNAPDPALDEPEEPKPEPKKKANKKAAKRA